MGSPARLFSDALKCISKPSSLGSTIYLALSGGVDSSVSGLLLREAGWRVKPVLMRCWDDDSGDEPACWEAEEKAAFAATKALSLQDNLQVVDLVAEYWTEVFDAVFLDGLQRGFTPNADLACNRAIKFGAFPERLRQLSASREDGEQSKTPKFATGHYARIRNVNGRTELLRGVDRKKDQSYFLGSIRGEILESVMFPVGMLHKSEVKNIAKWANLPSVGLRSSRGMCFIGKKRLGDFVQRYMEGKRGRIVDVKGNLIAHGDMPSFGYTIGQRARVGGLAEALYVVGKDGDDVMVSTAGDERLMSSEVYCERIDWIHGEPEGLDEGMRVQYKGCSTRAAADATIYKVDKGEGEGFVVKFDSSCRRIATGQAVVLYDGEVCLGAAWPIN